MNQDDFNYKALEQLKIITESLSSIEKLLNAESKPEPQEPEWRPMSEAPRDGTDIMCKLSSGEELNAWFSNKHGDWHVSRGQGLLGICQEYDLLGWRPL